MRTCVFFFRKYMAVILCTGMDGGDQFNLDRWINEEHQKIVKSGNIKGQNVEKRLTVEGGWFSWLKIVLFYSTIVFIFFHDSIIPKFTPVSTLAQKLHENSKYKFDGARCLDGWISRSQGEGTCSHHLGVDYYFYEGE